jgi:hypothetical protein
LEDREEFVVVERRKLGRVTQRIPAVLPGEPSSRDTLNDERVCSREGDGVRVTRVVDVFSGTEKTTFVRPFVS